MPKPPKAFGYRLTEQHRHGGPGDQLPLLLTFAEQRQRQDRLEQHPATDLRIALVDVAVGEVEVKLREQRPNVLYRIRQLGADFGKAAMLGVLESSPSLRILCRQWRCQEQGGADHTNKGEQAFRAPRFPTWGTAECISKARFRRHGDLRRAVVNGGRFARRGALRPRLLKRPSFGRDRSKG
jgi:hypothetical protein